MADKIAMVENVPGKEDQYIIKDGSGITAGRIFQLDYQPQHRSFIFRVQYYRQNNLPILKEAMYKFLKKVFTATNTHKVNVIVDEECNFRALTDLGFTLAGVIEENTISKGYYRSELLFEIDSIKFESKSKNSDLLLKGSNIELRNLTPENSEEMLNYYIRNREFLQPFEPAREESFYTIDVQKRILIESFRQYLNGTTLNLGIYKDNVLIGKVKLSNIVMGILRSANVGYSLDKDYEGRGYMREALSMVLDYAFIDMELHRVEASTLLDNIKSQKVLLACNFKELGINKEYLLINGAWRDHKTFYVINNEELRIKEEIRLISRIT